ncbi:hypothetical protein KAH81_08415 [bacterium]|nr:hypothetical protein [bacterium]
MINHQEPEFLLDENISPKIAKGFTAFGEKVDHLNEIIPKGTSDIKWIEQIGDEWILITNDISINKKPQEARALLDAGLSVFFIDLTTQPTFWDWLVFFVNHWEEWKQLAIETPRPFAYRITKKGSPKKIF